ncbi:hypothetical protein IOLA_087 [uncultured bacterium]|nr:hypothetical protein IOLA_087 [uncultured bacterium]
MSNPNTIKQVNNFYQNVLDKLCISVNKTPITSYSVHLFATSMLPILLILQVMDNNQHMKRNIISNSYIIATTNFLLKYLGDDGLISQTTNNLFNLVFMFDNPIILNHKCLSEILNHIVINKNIDYYEAIEIIRYLSLHIIMTHLLCGKLIPGFINSDDYIELNYLNPLLRLYQNNSKFNFEDFEKTMMILYLLPKKDLCLIHKYFVNISNKIGFSYNNYFMTLQDFILCIHAFLEEYTGQNIYSLNEMMSITSNNPYKIENFIFNFFSNKRSLPINLINLNKSHKISLNNIIKLIKNKSNIIEHIDNNDINVFTNNIINLASNLIPSYVEYQKMYLNQYNKFLIRNTTLSKFRELSYDLLGEIITLVFNDNRNLDKVANYILPVEEINDGKFKSNTGANLIYNRYVPFYIYKFWHFDLEAEIDIYESLDFNGFAYHTPYEIMQGLSYLFESISLLYNFGYIYSEILDFKLNNIFGLKNHSEYLIGRTLYNIINRHLPIPDRIKELIFANNNKIITYLMYQLSHNMSEFSINYIDLLTNNDINFNILNTFLLTKINTGLVGANSSELISEINSTLYERLCINNYLDIWNSNNDLIVVINYMSYIFKILPNINLRFGNNYKYLTFCLNKLFSSDIDNFSKYYKLLKRIVPGSYSLEQAILLREFIANDGCFKYNWLEQIINTLFALAYCVSENEFVVLTTSDPKIQKNSGIFNNLFRFEACHYIPKSSYSSYNAAHIIQALVLNEDISYRSNPSNYYQYFAPADYLSNEINAVNGVSGIIGALDDRFKFVYDNDQEKPVKITLSNNSIYNKFIDGDKYYNKACEVINLYESKKFMLHIMCRYKYIMHLLNNLNYIDVSDQKTGKIKIVNIGETLKFILYEILCTPFQTNFIQIYNENNTYNIESNKSKTEFIRPLVGYLRSSLLFCHHAQISRFHDLDGIYNGNSFERILYIVNAIVSVYHNSSMYNFKKLNKYKYSSRWFKSANVFNNRNRFSIIIKANKLHTFNSSLYLGRFTYEFAFRFKSNWYSISFAPVLTIMKNVFNRLTNIGIISIKDKNDKEIQYYGSHSASIGNVLLLLDLLGNQVISRFIAPSKYDIVSEPLFRRYKFRENFITEYSASNILYLPLLAIQSCNQYIKAEDSKISIIGNHNTVLGIIPIKEFSFYIVIDILSTVIVAIMRLVYIFLSLLTLLMKSINNFISSKSRKDRIINIEGRLNKEKKILQEYSKMI